MQKYEITYFTAPDEKTNVVETALKDLGGVVLENNNIGIRELAYEVEGLKEALFTSVIFEADSDKLKDLEKKLNHDKKIIRFILIKALRQTEKIEKEDSAKPKEVKNDKAKTEEKEEEAPVPIAKTPSEPKEKPTGAIKPKAKKPSKKIVKKQQEEMPDEELDKKLKELVED